MHFSTLLAAFVSGAATVAAQDQGSKDVLVFNTGGCDSSFGLGTVVELLGGECVNFGQPGVFSVADPFFTIEFCQIFGSPDCQNKCTGTPTRVGDDCVDLTNDCIAASVSCPPLISGIPAAV
jgi:hypothetical protein